MPARPAAVELLDQLARVLGKRRWYVFGAQAVNVHGRPRMTADVDVTIEIERGELSAFVRKLERAGFKLRVEDPAKFLQATSVLPFVHEGTGMPLDIVRARSALESAFLDRAERRDLGGVVVPVISPSDLVVTKILAGRAKDLDDATSVLRARTREVDVEGIRNLLGQIEDALDQSDLKPAFERALAAARRQVRRNKPRAKSKGRKK
jgi:uncharacterized nucleotidyltransferase DUF6036